MKSDDKIIYIIYPNSFQTISCDSLNLSELIINSFVKSNKKLITLCVNTKLKLVESNDNSVKVILDVLLKSNTLKDAKNQLCALLHHDNDSLGILKCYNLDTEINFRIKEMRTETDFSWQITRQHS